MGFFRRKEGLLDVCEQFLQADDWHPERSEDGQRLVCGFQGENVELMCMVFADEEAEQVFIYSRPEKMVPEQQRQAAAEFITRANFGLKVGNFEMDYEDGEVLYKTSIDVEGGELTETMIRNLMYANVVTMDRHWPAMLRVVEEGASPADAVAEVEAS